MSTITARILELQGLDVPQLAQRYAELFGAPPRVRNRSFLLRRVAWKLQEREFGGLSERAKLRLDELASQINLPLRDPTPPRPRAVPRPDPRRSPAIGTTLVRRWRDQELRVEVRDQGFEWHGTLYRSLSAVARAITGSAWNGRLFFGLTKRRATP